MAEQTNQGVDVDGERLHQTLFGRVAHCGSRGGVWPGTLTRFVGVDPALDPPHDGQTQNGAKASIKTEGAFPDQHDHARQGMNVEGDDDAGHDDVAERHKGHYGTGKVGDALDATEDDEAEQQCQTGRRHVRIDIKRSLQTGADGVGLHARQQYTAGEDGGDGKRPGIPLHAKPFLYVEGRPAAVFAVDLLLVDLTQGGLHEGGAGAEEGDHPHPEHGTRATEGNGGGNTCNIAGADATGEGHGQRLEGGDPRIRALAIKHQPDHFGHMAQLQKAAAY